MRSLSHLMMWWMVIVLGAVFAAPAEPPECEPSIRIIEQDESAIIEGACISFESDPHNSELSYRLRVERIGAGGTSQSNQSGSFTPGARAADTLSRTSVTFAPGDVLHVRLTILLEDREIASTEVRRERP